MKYLSDRTYLVVTGGTVVLAVLLAYFLWLRPPATPQWSQERPTVRPGAEFVNAGSSIDYYRHAIRRDPNVVQNYVDLAQVYMQQARSSGEETRYLPEARDLLESALRRDPQHYHALVLKASLLNKLHRFAEARDLARELIARHDHHAYTWGILVDALVELGNYEEAVTASDHLLSIRPGLDSYARAAYLRELHGDSDGAIEAMTMAADAGVPGSEDRAWALYQLGMLYLGQAKLDEAAHVFSGILEERPDYPFAIGGLGHVALVRGMPGEAIGHLERAYRQAPDGHFLELLAPAYRATGDTARAVEAERQILRNLKEAEAMGEEVDMEYADVLADLELRLPEALRRARQAYARRPDHLHVLETYAWVLYKSGRAEEALPHIERAMRLNTGDAMVHFRAAHIYRDVGLRAEAQHYLRSALDQQLHVESGEAADEAEMMLGAL